jgi:hypothetical protein
MLFLQVSYFSRSLATFVFFFSGRQAALTEAKKLARILRQGLAAHVQNKAQRNWDPNVQCGCQDRNTGIEVTLFYVLWNSILKNGF